MPARASHLPNVFERNALQELKIGELPGRRIGTASVIAKLLAKGWIECGSAARSYRITSAGTEALRSGCRNSVVVESEEVTPTVLVLLLAFLAFAVLAIRHFVRSKDVLYGGYIEDSDHRGGKE